MMQALAKKIIVLVDQSVDQKTKSIVKDETYTITNEIAALKKKIET
mgnify:CR=1 FL=1